MGVCMETGLIGDMRKYGVKSIVALRDADAEGAGTAEDAQANIQDQHCSGR